MKKTYMNPSMNVLTVDEKDVIATSSLTDGGSGNGTVKTMAEIMGMAE